MSKNPTEIETNHAVGGQLDAIVMRRELKFRAWDANNKDMFYFDGVFSDAPHKEVSRFLRYESIKKPENLEVMQFTGLQDINGKEVFEGDILNPDFKEYSPCYSEVVFEDGSFRKKYQYLGKALDKPRLSANEIDIIRLVVVGNIFENPELLVDV